MFYNQHVFVCTNQKLQGKQCCANAGADAIFTYLKQAINDKGLAGPGKIRVSKSGCLGRCALGPCLVFYPEGLWYSYSSQSDLDEIITQVLDQGGQVLRLLIDKEV